MKSSTMTCGQIADDAVRSRTATHTTAWRATASQRAWPGVDYGSCGRRSVRHLDLLSCRRVLWIRNSFDRSFVLSANGGRSTDVCTAWHGDRLWTRQRHPYPLSPLGSMVGLCPGNCRERVQHWRGSWRPARARLSGRYGPTRPIAAQAFPFSRWRALFLRFAGFFFSAFFNVDRDCSQNLFSIAHTTFSASHTVDELACNSQKSCLFHPRL
jgi:hypothetical protein